MSLKALARQWVERNRPCKPTATDHENRATFDATGEGARATADDIAERAAIVAEGARVPTDWAEGFAMLEARPIPPNVRPEQWLGMITAAGRFLDAWGGKAAALGWTAAELFGLDPVAPMNRLDRRGGAFFLTDAEVVDVTAEAITLRRQNRILILRRAWRKGCERAAWELLSRKETGNG